MIKNPPKKRKKTVKKKSPEVKQIPQDILEHFVGYVPNMWMVTAGHLWENRFRVNVWTEEWSEDRVTPTHRIVKSFFVHYHDAEQMIIDKTIVPKPKKDKIF